MAKEADTIAAEEFTPPFLTCLDASNFNSAAFRTCFLMSFSSARICAQESKFKNLLNREQNSPPLAQDVLSILQFFARLTADEQLHVQASR